MGIILEGSMPLLFGLGKVLSVVAVVLTLAALWSVWRRDSFPGVSYGRIYLSQKRLRWVWILVLVGAFGFGVNEDPIAVNTPPGEEVEAAEGVEAGIPTRIVSTTLPLPFYRYEREKAFEDGELVRDHIVEGFVLPWPLISALVAYFVLVVRWDPDRPLARRILQGRKWRMEEEMRAE